MNIEHQVCSFELAQQLKGLGISQNSLFFWQESAFMMAVDENGKNYVAEIKISLCFPPEFDLSQSINYWNDL